VSSLTLDAGVRLQGGFGKAQYNGGNLGNSGTVLGSASLVWNFYRDMHVKANYASGFRPPVFNNTDSNDSGRMERQAFAQHWPDSRASASRRLRLHRSERTYRHIER
jgi:outer membrane receptor protein involved in Fe transport